MIKISAFADETLYSFDGQLSFLDRADVRNLEIRFVDGVNVVNLPPEKVRQVRAGLCSSGIGLSAIGSPIGKVSLTDPFEPHFDLFKRTVEIASELDARLIRIFSFYPSTEDKDADRDEVLARLTRMLDYVRGSEIVLAHENESRIFGHSAENCAFLAKELGCSNFTLVYDPANFVWGEGITNPTESCYPVMAPYVGHVHIKDWKKGSTDIGSLPGEGDGQIDLLIQRLAESGYDGFVSLEPHMQSGGQFGGNTSEEQFVQAIGKVREMCRKHGLEYC